MTLLVLGLMTVTGCGEDGSPTPASAADVESSRTTVQEAMRSVIDVAAGLVLDVPEATGSWSVCSANPPRLKYGAGGAATSTTSVPESIASLTSALEDAGWTVDDAGTTPEPYATLTRADLRASLGESRRTPGAVSIGVTGPCIDIDQDQDSLLGETDPIGRIR